MTHAWSAACENISYVYGFQAAEHPQYAQTGYNGPAYEFVGPHERKTIGDMVVHAIVSNDGGAGFLVEVDGLRIFHAGDHAGWREGEREGFTAEIDYLAELVSDVDMAFMNVTGCHHQDTVALEESICYTFEKLNPKCWFPTHGMNNERVYGTFADKIARRGYTCEAACAENRGDCFIYRNGSINTREGSI